MYQQYPSAPSDTLHHIYCFMVFFTVGLALLPFINIITFVFPCTFIKHTKLNHKLPLPSCLEEISDFRNHKRHLSGRYYCSQCVALLFGYISCSWLLELIAYHFIYIVLGTIVTPMETLATLSFMISAFLCVVIFCAIVFKSTSLNNYDGKAWNIICCTLPVMVVGILFLGCLGCFMWYFHTYITLVQTYNTSQGIWHVIGSILPTIFSSIFVLWGKYMLDNLKNDDARDSNDRANNGNGVLSRDEGGRQTTQYNTI